MFGTAYLHRAYYRHSLGGSGYLSDAIRENGCVNTQKEKKY